MDSNGLFWTFRTFWINFTSQCVFVKRLSHAVIKPEFHTLTFTVVTDSESATDHQCMYVFTSVCVIILLFVALKLFHAHVFRNLFHTDLIISNVSCVCVDLKYPDKKGFFPSKTALIILSMEGLCKDL